MALIKCTECGKEFSDKAAACPNCGCPTSEILKELPVKGKDDKTEKQVLNLVNKTLEEAKKAGVEFELAADRLAETSKYTSIDLNGSSSSMTTAMATASRIEKSHADICDKLYLTYQTLVKTLDGGCRPLLKNNPGTKAVKAVAGTIAWLNDESKIEDNYPVAINGISIGSVLKKTYVPDPLNLAIQGIWEAEYNKLPDHTEAERFWSQQIENHKKSSAKAERDARQKVLDDKRQADQALRDYEKSIEKDKEQADLKRKEVFSSNFEKNVARMEYITPAKGLCCTGPDGSEYVYIDAGGRAVCKRHYFKSVHQGTFTNDVDDPGDVSKMTDLCQIYMNNQGVFGLRRDGTVAVSRISKAKMQKYGYSDCLNWKNIKKIAGFEDFVVGLRYDGTCVGTRISAADGKYEERDNKAARVESWKDIKDITCGYVFTAGLKSDGTVCWCGTDDRDRWWLNWKNKAEYEQNRLDRCKNWKDIIYLTARYDQLIGIKKDGSILQTSNDDIQALSAGTNIVDVCRTYSWQSERLVGLQADGHIINVEKNWLGNVKTGSVQKDIDNIVAIYSASERGILVLKENGNLEEYKYNESSSDDSKFSKKGSFCICPNYSEYQKKENERIAAVYADEQLKQEVNTLRKERRKKDLCQYCGGEFEKKLLGWKCKECGKKKDY